MKFPTIIVGYIFISLLIKCQAIIVYKSLESIESDEPFSGLRLIPTSVSKSSNFTHGLSFCARFNYRRLGWNSYTFFTLVPYKFIWLPMGNTETFFFFGKMNWILKDSDSFRIWSTNKWHHICVSFDRISFNLKVVKDGFLTNINFTEPSILDNYSLNSSLLDGFLLGRTDKQGSSTHSGQISDFHMWDKALNDEEMKAWTTCRYRYTKIFGLLSGFTAK